MTRFLHALLLAVWASAFSSAQSSFANFTPAVTYGTGGYSGAVSVAVGDVNGDGKPDLVVANACAHYTTTFCQSAPNPSVIAQTVTFTAAVAGQHATPTGTVNFTINGNKPVSVPLANGQTTFTWTFATQGYAPSQPATRETRSMRRVFPLL